MIIFGKHKFVVMQYKQDGYDKDFRYHASICSKPLVGYLRCKKVNAMKKLFIFAIVATVLTSCGTMQQTPAYNTKFTSTSTYTRVGVAKPITAVIADLEVSPQKITYVYVPSRAVRKGGFDNIVNCAVQEALFENGEADVMVALEQQVKYDGDGECESITITGYPAKYKNFRSPGDAHIIELSKGTAAEGKPAEAASVKPTGGLGFGFKLK